MKDTEFKLEYSSSEGFFRCGVYIKVVFFCVDMCNFLVGLIIFIEIVF